MEVLLNLFRKKDLGISILTTDNIEEWIQHEADKLIDQAGLQQEIPQYTQRIKELRWLLEVKLDTWDKKLLHQSETTKNEIRYFFSETKHLLELITFHDKPTLEQVLTLNENLLKNIEKIIRRIELSSFSKNFDFLLPQETQHTHANPLLQELITLQSTVQEFQTKVKDSGLNTIQELVKQKTNLIKTNQVLHELAKDVEAKQDRLRVAEKKLQEKQQELYTLEHNPEYKKTLATTQKRKELQQEIKEHEQGIKNFFTPLKSLLELHKQIEPENKMIHEYILHPIKAFHQDEGLSILHILNHLEAALLNGKLNIKLDEMAIADNSFTLLKEGYLQKVQQEKLRLQKQLDTLKTQPLDKEFTLKLEETKYRLDHFSKQVHMLQSQLATLEEKGKELQAKNQHSQQHFKNIVRVSFQKDIKLNL